MRKALPVSLAVTILQLSAAIGLAVDFSSVPGTVINYQPSPSWTVIFGQLVVTGTKLYLSSPSITIAPNGDYFVSHDYFANDTIEGQGQTSIYRSTDKGLTWTHTKTITGSSSSQATTPGAYQSTIFYYNNALYLWGPSKTSGYLVIRQSTDNGVTWTNPTTSTTGQLNTGGFGGTSNTPAIYNSRLWFAQSGKRVASAPISSNLLLSTSWTLSNTANTDTGPFGSPLTVTEAQVIASPQTGVLILPKIDEKPNTVLLRVNPSNIAAMINPATADWVSLPGGDKKFGAQYDPVSQKFYVLNNPILPAYASANPGDTSLTRNTAAILSSKDLYHWNVERIFLFSTNVDHEGYQYFNFAIEGNDLAVVSRTAKVLPGENQPPRGHDSNLITFHRITNFRTIRPVYQLSLDTANNNERRYERAELYATVSGVPQYQWAPLGSFQVGTSFAGAALSQPNGHVQDTNGDVYIREQGGRILRFDPLGNFLNTVTSLPSGLSFTTSDIYITPPAVGDSGWIKTGAGKWSDPLNWFYWGRPDTNSEIACFGSAISADVDIDVDQDFTVKGVVFRDDNRYRLAGTGLLTLEADAGRSLLKIEQGNHRISTNIKLNSDTDINLDDHLLQFYGNLNLNGKSLFVHGDTRLEAGSSFVMNNGWLVLDGLFPFTFGTSSANLNGTLQFLPSGGASLTLGASFTLINWTAAASGTFTAVVMPTLAVGLKWDTSALYTTGVVKVVSDPAAQPPGAPTGLTAAWSGTQVNLSWSAVSGATSYKVSRATTSGGPYTQIASGVTATSYADSGLATGTYYYVVAAVNTFGTGAQSSQASVNVPPGAPASLSATPVGTSVSLSWGAVSGAASYKVERSTTSGGPYTQIASGVAVTNYTDSGLALGTYFYVVSAVNAQGTGPRSNQASASVSAPVPVAPANLTAQAGDGKVTLNWNAVSGAISYSIKVGLSSGGPYVPLASGVTDTSYVDNNLSNGTTYYYVVAAVNAVGTGPDSNQASATPSPPPKLTGAVSRKTHGSAGTFDINLPLTGANGVEPRSAGTAGHTLVLTFDQELNPTQQGMTVEASSGQLAETPVVSGATLAIRLTGVANASRCTVTIGGLKSADGSGYDGSFSFEVLESDVNGNRSVNVADAAVIRQSSGQPVGPANFRSDINANGSINAGDSALQRQDSGNTLP